MNYVIFNKDGSLLQKSITETINQNSDGVNKFFITVKGMNDTVYGVAAVFRLPNGTSTMISSTQAGVQVIDGSIYNGYIITLTALETVYAGNLVMSIIVKSSQTKGTLWTYPLYLTINETVVDAESPISKTEYLSLVEEINKIKNALSSQARSFLIDTRLTGIEIRQKISRGAIFKNEEGTILTEEYIEDIEEYIFNSRFATNDDSISIYEYGEGFIAALEDKENDIYVIYNVEHLRIGDNFKLVNTNYSERFYDGVGSAYVDVYNSVPILDDLDLSLSVSEVYTKIKSNSLVKIFYMHDEVYGKYLVTIETRLRQPGVREYLVQYYAFDDGINYSWTGSGSTPFELVFDNSNNITLNAQDIEDLLKSVEKLPMYYGGGSPTTTVEQVYREVASKFSPINNKVYFYDTWNRGIVQLEKINETLYNYLVWAKDGYCNASGIANTSVYRNIFSNLSYKYLTQDDKFYIGGVSNTKIKTAYERQFQNKQNVRLGEIEGDTYLISISKSGTTYNVELLDPINGDFHRYNGVSGDIDFMTLYEDVEATQEHEFAKEDWTLEQIRLNGSHFLSKNAYGDTFATKAELESATVFYFGTQVHEPDENDITLVASDETHANKVARYSYQNGSWVFQYVIPGIDSEQLGEILEQLNTLSERLTEVDEDLSQEITSLKNSKTDKAFIDIGVVTFTGVDNKVFPQISNEVATTIYDTFASGTPVILKWAITGVLPIELLVLASDNAGGKTFDVLIHNEYLCEYTISAGTYATCKVVKLGGGAVGKILHKLTYNGTDIRDEDGEAVGFTQIKALIDSPYDFVYIDDTTHLAIFYYSAYENDAMWFNTRYLIEDEEHLLRLIINDQNQIQLNDNIVPVLVDGKVPSSVLPVATTSALGMATTKTYFGLGIDGGNIKLINVSNQYLISRPGSGGAGFGAITTTNYDKVTKLALTAPIADTDHIDGSAFPATGTRENTYKNAWTDEEKSRARARLGIDEQYELIEEITLTEETNEISRSDLNLKKMVIKTSFPASSNQTYFLRINGYYGEIISLATTIRNYFCYCDVSEGIMSVRNISYSNGVVSDSQNYTGVQHSQAQLVSKIENITILKTSGSVNLPVGTVITIYGIKA